MMSPLLGAGVLVWASLAWVQPPLAVWILAFAPTVIVPLGLVLLRPRIVVIRARKVLKVGQWFLFPGATMFVASFWFQQGALATVFAIPWFVTTLLLALPGAMMLWRNGRRIDAQSSLAAALLFLPVGAGWAMISRAGLRPQEFSHEIVLLTGVHFHYAGFALPILAASAVNERPVGWQRLLIAAIVMGIPLVGVGISLSPSLELAAAVLLAMACLLLAAMQAREALTLSEANRAMLLLISSTSLAAAMLLAGVYAVGEFTEARWLSIPVMIQTHGVLNAFGFVLCGLLARAIEDRKRNGGLAR